MLLVPAILVEGMATVCMDLLVPLTPPTGNSTHLSEEHRVMESAQLAYDREGDAFERSVEADAPTIKQAGHTEAPEPAHQLLEKLLASEGASTHGPPLGD
jgi:hypothetical protein